MYIAKGAVAGMLKYVVSPQTHRSGAWVSWCALILGISFCEVGGAYRAESD